MDAVSAISIWNCEHPRILPRLPLPADICWWRIADLTADTNAGRRTPTYGALRAALPAGATAHHRRLCPRRPRKMQRPTRPVLQRRNPGRPPRPRLWPCLRDARTPPHARGRHPELRLRRVRAHPGGELTQSEGDAASTVSRAAVCAGRPDRGVGGALPGRFPPLPRLPQASRGRFHASAALPRAAVTIEGATRGLGRAVFQSAPRLLRRRVHGRRDRGDLGILDAPDRFTPAYESRTIRRESWLLPFPLAKQVDLITLERNIRVRSDLCS